jgi:hypothetical protein
MSKPKIHADNSVVKYGGKWEDYIEIHDFMDSSKSAFPEISHRVVLHHAFGTFIVEKVFGHILINSDNKEVSVRQLAEDHIIEDLGFIPTLGSWLKTMDSQPWMNGANRNDLRSEKKPVN